MLTVGRAARSAGFFIGFLACSFAGGVYSLLVGSSELAFGALPFPTNAPICRGSTETIRVARQSPLTPSALDGSFAEEFTGNAGLNRFRRGIYHRNIGAQQFGQEPVIWGDANASHGGTWTADHDLSCGPPDTQRNLSSTKQPTIDFSLDKIFYVCVDHVMSTMGNVDGYSIAWFSPDSQFDRTAHKRISWDVNVTDLGARQWWEVSIVPVGAKIPAASVSWLTSTANIGEHDARAVVVGSGPVGRTVNITSNKKNYYGSGRQLCGSYGLDPSGCASKKIRRPFSIVDNENGTMTVNYGGLFSRTIPGKLPDKFEVYFEIHSYNPDKDGKPSGYTWHWDNIRVE